MISVFVNPETDRLYHNMKKYFVLLTLLRVERYTRAMYVYSIYNS